MHEDVKTSARLDPQGFGSLWADLVPLFQQADLAFANLETPIAPTAGRPGVPFQFNAPETLAPALRASGFTVLATANNHAYDQGTRGLVETLSRLRAEGLLAVGSGEDRARAEALQIIERQGFRVALLAFTDLFNQDLNQPDAGPWVRPLHLDLAVNAVREARRQADLVILSVHWGNEYQHTPSPRQREAARALVAAGCDLILGHHPHVLQPVEYLEVEGHRALVAYSLGNFISNQDRMYPGDRTPVAEGDNRDGAALRVHFERGPGGLHIKEASVEPLWTENNWGQAGPRRIQVVRIGAAEARLRRELGQLEDPVEGPKLEPGALKRALLIQGKQAYQRTLVKRRQRIAEVVGRGFVAMS
jgi:poly-gamma-glutamate synthesis protein (capsule biosynthesis protein)